MVIRANPDTPPPLIPEVSITTAAPSVVVIDNSNSAIAQASVGLAQTSIDKEIVESQLDQQEEHWVKAYWRPAMGWLYMAINLMDFIIFPAISMFIPIIYKAFGVQIGYTAWVPLTLSNGGLIHLSFAAILGVAAWTRGQEKLAKVNGSN